MLLKVAETPSAHQAPLSSHPQQHDGDGVLYQQLYLNVIDSLLSSTSVGSWRVTS